MRLYCIKTQIKDKYIIKEFGKTEPFYFEKKWYECVSVLVGDLYVINIETSDVGLIVPKDCFLTEEEYYNSPLGKADLIKKRYE